MEEKSISWRRKWVRPIGIHIHGLRNTYEPNLHKMTFNVILCKLILTAAEIGVLWYGIGSGKGFLTHPWDGLKVTSSCLANHFGKTNLKFRALYCSCRSRPLSNTTKLVSVASNRMIFQAEQPRRHFAATLFFLDCLKKI